MNKIKLTFSRSSLSPSITVVMFYDRKFIFTVDFNYKTFRLYTAKKCWFSGFRIPYIIKKQFVHYSWTKMYWKMFKRKTKTLGIKRTRKDLLFALIKVFKSDMKKNIKFVVNEW